MDIEVLERSPLGIEDCALYPLFTDELLQTMRDLIDRERLDKIAVCAIIRARRS